MGMNSTVVIDHDQLHMIEKDPFFGAKLANACQRVGVNDPVDLGVAKVIECHHSSLYRLILVGGKSAIVTEAGASTDLFKEDELLVAAFKDLAHVLGYRVSKIKETKR